MFEDIGKLILRISVGGLMLFHGIFKLAYGIEGVTFLVTSMGLPSFMSYGVYLGEILAPIMLILGFRVKIASILMMATMIVAILAVTSGDIFGITDTGGWVIELQAFYFLGALALFFLDSGRFALDIKKTK